jgi:hypothetical protein
MNRHFETPQGFTYERDIEWAALPHVLYWLPLHPTSDREEGETEEKRAEQP